MEKKSVIKIALLLIFVFSLSACSISGEIYEKIPHTDVNTGDIPSDLRLASSYQAILELLSGTVAAADNSLKIAVQDYIGDLDRDLKDIIMQVTMEDAIGSFAVSSILSEQAAAQGYQQVSFAIQYKRTPEEIRSIVNVLGDKDFEEKLMDEFEVFGSGGIYRIVTTKSDSQLLMQVNKAYYSRATSAIGLKSVKISPTKNTYKPQIVEIELEYLWSLGDLNGKKNKIAVDAIEICRDVSKDSSFSEKVAFVGGYISQNISVDTEATRVVLETGDTQPKSEVYSALGAFENKSASQTGIVMAAKALLSQLSVENRTVIGFKGDNQYMWLMVKNGDTWQHFDVLEPVDGQLIPFNLLDEKYTYDSGIFGLN